MYTDFSNSNSELLGVYLNSYFLYPNAFFSCKNPEAQEMTELEYPIITRLLSPIFYTQ